MTLLIAVVQVIGGVAVLFEIAAYQLKHRKSILWFQFMANMLWVLHFAFLGAWTGAALNLVGGMRAFVFNRRSPKTSQSQWLLWVFIGIVIIAAVLSWQGTRSILAMGGMICGTVAFWQRDEQRIRMLILCGGVPLWTAYDILSGSYAGVVNEVLVLTSTSLGLWRYRHSRSTRFVELG